MPTNLANEPFASDWRLSDQESDALLRILLSIRANPYLEQEAFLDEVRSIRSEPTQHFSDSVARLRRETDLDEKPVLYIRNLPVEADLPVFGHNDPVADKYVMKTSFVTEALLALLAEAADTPIIGYRTINNGDLYHDIYLKESHKHTASQKSMVSFGFHYDMGFKKVRPDWANLACLRSSSANMVSTSLSRNIDILAELSAADLAVLSASIYTTPPEVVSQMGGEASEQIPLRPIYFPDKPWKFEYFEGRTVSDDTQAMVVVGKLNTALHRNKRLLVLEPGDLAVISNNHGTHCREVLNVSDMAAHRLRWLIKTYNVDDLAPHRSHFVAGSVRRANE